MAAERRGEKRSRKQASDSNFLKIRIDENSPIIKSFRKHQQELDSRHDKHERLVKCSRDVTIASKRIIFLLQRAGGSDNQELILKEADEKFLEVKGLLKMRASELDGEDSYLFSRAYSYSRDHIYTFACPLIQGSFHLVKRNNINLYNNYSMSPSWI